MNVATNTREVGDVTVVDVSGRIVLGEETGYLRSLVNNLLTGGHNKILFNLSQVSYIDTSGLGFLLSALASARKQNGEVKLVNLPPKVLEVMEITKLYTVFDVSDDEATAVRSFNQSAAAGA
jgi:anti-sigma B factor antagonist